ncbi:MAG: thioredoxin-like domain-containing protein [Mangrovibacterium sp.]
MRKSIVFIIAVIAIACNDASQYKIQGRISNAEGRYIYLDELKLTSTVNIDSVKLDKNGEFKFRGHISYPTFFLLRLSENKTNFVTLLVDSAEQVEVSGDAANFYRDYLVKGSEGSALVQELNKQLSKTKHKLDSIRSLQLSFRNEVGYELKRQQWEAEYEQVRQAQVNYSKKFVETHPFSMANVLALYQKFDDDTYVIQDLQSLKVAASALNSFFPESEHVKALYANTTKLMQEERNARLSRFIQQEGENSPDIILPDPDGKKIALSSLRGKYVLLQFWASADRGSRIMNPVLAELYKKYHSKGFEIYQVSVDNNRYDWINAIDEDGLDWINVGDMEGSKVAVITYNVTEIPFNYLLNNEGVVIGKNIKGPALDKILGQVL